MLSYESTRLTFKRDSIEPLNSNDEIQITVFGEAVYRMTKKDFHEIFHNVVKTKSYNKIGSYNYKKTPSKAHKFIVRVF